MKGSAFPGHGPSPGLTFKSSLHKIGQNYESHANDEQDASDFDEPERGSQRVVIVLILWFPKSPSHYPSTNLT